MVFAIYIIIFLQQMMLWCFHHPSSSVRKASVVHTCEISTSTSIKKMSVHTRELSTRKWKVPVLKVDWWQQQFTYACFTNVHTGETKEISTSTRERKIFLFLVLVLVLISQVWTRLMGLHCNLVNSRFKFFVDHCELFKAGWPHKSSASYAVFELFELYLTGFYNNYSSTFRWKTLTLWLTKIKRNKTRSLHLRPLL